MKRLCQVPQAPVRPVPATASPQRQNLIRLYEKKWVNGTTIKYHFLRDPQLAGTPQLEQTCRDAWQQWKDVGTGLNFQEVELPEESDVRIGFQRGDGSWSNLGRDVLEIPKDERTMNFGWDITRDPDTAVHEVGHTLGFPHEHQNPNAGIVWNKEEVYKQLGGPPNSWSKQTTYRNIIYKYPVAAVDGGNWDPNSIMHYPFEPGMILEPEEYYKTGLNPEPGMSEEDRVWIRSFYPPLAPSESLPLLKYRQAYFESLSPGEQLDLRVAPPDPKSYTFQTTGESDTVMVLFGDDGGNETTVAADDDSGIDRNARFKVDLESGKQYVLRVRLYYAEGEGDVGVLYQ